LDACSLIAVIIAEGWTGKTDPTVDHRSMAQRTWELAMDKVAVVFSTIMAHYDIDIAVLIHVSARLQCDCRICICIARIHTHCSKGTKYATLGTTLVHHNAWFSVIPTKSVVALATVVRHREGRPLHYKSGNKDDIDITIGVCIDSEQVFGHMVHCSAGGTVLDCGRWHHPWKLLQLDETPIGNRV
jgi:hypothetical protein